MDDPPKVFALVEGADSALKALGVPAAGPNTICYGAEAEWLS